MIRTTNVDNNGNKHRKQRSQHFISFINKVHTNRSALRSSKNLYKNFVETNKHDI